MHQNKRNRLTDNADSSSNLEPKQLLSANPLNLEAADTTSGEAFDDFGKTLESIVQSGAQRQDDAPLGIPIQEFAGQFLKGISADNKEADQGQSVESSRSNASNEASGKALEELVKKITPEQSSQGIGSERTSLTSTSSDSAGDLEISDISQQAGSTFGRIAGGIAGSLTGNAIGPTVGQAAGGSIGRAIGNIGGNIAENIADGISSKLRGSQDTNSNSASLQSTQGTLSESGRPTTSNEQPESQNTAEASECLSNIRKQQSESDSRSDTESSGDPDLGSEQSKGPLRSFLTGISGLFGRLFC